MFGFVSEKDYNDLKEQYNIAVKERDNFQNSYNKIYDAALEEHKKFKELQKELKALKLEGQNKPLKIHNERGAGRKQVATANQIMKIINLHNEGLSYAKIITALKLPFSKGTIKNIIDRENLKAAR